MWKTPKFWYQHGSLLGTFLKPLSWLYYAGYRLKKRLVPQRRSTCPVICVGNVVAGGAGKTPTTIALAEIFTSLGLTPHLLTRGYGGKEIGPHLVSEGDAAKLIGDEAILLSRAGPTWVSRKRLFGAKAAAKAGADVIIMDDGLQNFSLEQMLSFLVIDGERGLGNGEMIPAGPLREPLDAVKKRAHAVIFVGDDLCRLKESFAEMPVFTARVKAVGKSWDALNRKKVIAFAGIAHPTKFFETLRQHGCAIIGQRAFPDHHPYEGSDLRPLIQRAAESKALLVTTEKDFTRIPLKYRSYVQAMPIKLVFDDPEKITAFIQCAFEAHSCVSAKTKKIMAAAISENEPVEIAIETPAPPTAIQNAPESKISVKKPAVKKMPPPKADIKKGGTTKVSKKTAPASLDADGVISSPAKAGKSSKTASQASIEGA